MATKQVIRTDAAPSSPLYSQGVRVGQHVHVSGMVGVDVATGRLAGATVQAQTRQALANCEAVLKAAGGSLERVVEVGVLLTHPSDFVAMNEAYGEVFPTDPPARYVAKLGVELPDVLVSIRLTAIVD